MAGVQATELFNCTVPQFFSLITDYEKYPEYLAEVKSCKVVERRDRQKLVEFNVSLIKNFSYRLWMTENPPHSLSWLLDSGDLFKASTGAWELAEEAERTRATYTLDAKFKIFVPGPIAKALVNVNLPNMMSSYHKRVKELYGK